MDECMDFIKGGSIQTILFHKIKYHSFKCCIENKYFPKNQKQTPPTPH